MNLGSYDIDDALTFSCNTHRVDTGAATDADSAPSYRVYEDETSTPILTGTMALLDGSNTAGFYSEQITLSAANGFERGKCYSVYISATVNSVTGTTSRQFQVGAKVDVRAIGGDAQSATDLKDFADAGYDPSTNKVQGVVLVDTTTTLTGHTAQTGDAYARLGAPAGASVSADIALVKADTGNLDATISSRATPAQVAAELATYDGPTNAEMVARTLVAANYATAAAQTTAQDDITDIKAVVDLLNTAQADPAALAGEMPATLTPLEKLAWVFVRIARLVTFDTATGKMKLHNASGTAIAESVSSEPSGTTSQDTELGAPT